MDKPDDKKDPHSVRIVAIRPAGDTFSVDLGVYEIEKNKILFDLTEIADFTSPYTVSAPTAEAPGQLTLGTEVYFKVTGSLDGPQLGGQIQISQAATDEGVTVSSAHMPAVKCGGPSPRSGCSVPVVCIASATACGSAPTGMKQATT